MKLHLGCGERYLDGYTNIDYPKSEHSVQQNTKVDRYADISQLAFPTGTIEEVRLHHVFEHFSRPVATAFIATWSQWLRSEGKLRIEVPDLQMMSKILTNTRIPLKERRVAERHLFGSHEAHWAVHWCGYDEDMFRDLLNRFGFYVSNVERNSWMGTHNLEVFAVKREFINRDSLATIGREYLRDFLLDDGPSESLLLDALTSDFKKQLDKGLNS